jgi:hypothetical protein
MIMHYSALLYRSPVRRHAGNNPLARRLTRPTHSPETRAWLEATYGVQTPEPGQWLQTLTFVEDGVDNFVLEGDRRVFVNEPASGQKLEVGYFKDKTTVGELRHKLRMLLLHRGRARYANGCGFEAESGELQWIRGPLICGGVLLADDSRTLTSYEVKGGFQGEPSVIFSVGSVGQFAPGPTLFHQISVSRADFD